MDEFDDNDPLGAADLDALADDDLGDDWEDDDLDVADEDEDEDEEDDWGSDEEY